MFAEIDSRAAEAGGLGSVERLAYQFLTTYLPEDILTKTDRASMFNSLEVRAPFLGRALAEYACGLPTRLKLRGREKKYISEAAGLPLPAAGHRIPQEARLRRADRRPDRERCSGSAAGMCCCRRATRSRSGSTVR